MSIHLKETYPENTYQFLGLDYSEDREFLNLDTICQDAPVFLFPADVKRFPPVKIFHSHYVLHVF